MNLEAFHQARLNLESNITTEKYEKALERFIADQESEGMKWQKEQLIPVLLKDDLLASLFITRYILSSRSDDSLVVRDPVHKVMDHIISKAKKNLNRKEDDDLS